MTQKKLFVMERTLNVLERASIIRCLYAWKLFYNLFFWYKILKLAALRFLNTSIRLMGVFTVYVYKHSSTNIIALSC